MKTTEDVRSLMEAGYDFHVEKIIDAQGQHPPISVTWFADVQLAKPGGYFPNVKLFSRKSGRFYDPIEEKIMSLQLAPSLSEKFSVEDYAYKHEDPVFFFVYNSENYYHFVYDSLPYLLVAKKLRERIPGLKLLVNYPSRDAREFYRFVDELTELAGFGKTQAVILDDRTVYSQVLVSQSLTHNSETNSVPHPQVYPFLRSLKADTTAYSKCTPRIYISRRTSTSNDRSNIGTDYTQRRRLVNEDELVALLTLFGFEEVFTETLSSSEKIALFQQAEVVVGAIGGGVCNVLFSPPSTRLMCIVSPTFLDVNERFLHAFKNIEYHLFKDTFHVDSGPIRPFTRVYCEELKIVGEVTKVDGPILTVSYANDVVAGWSASTRYSELELPAQSCRPLDHGLNSPWSMNLDRFKKKLVKLL
jgi:hypothetical protein